MLHENLLADDLGVHGCTQHYDFCVNSLNGEMKQINAQSVSPVIQIIMYPEAVMLCSFGTKPS